MNTYQAASGRYDKMTYRRCGRSGLLLPAISLGLWHNFGGDDDFENARIMLRRSFDLGITHFDLANNYGPPPGSAEENFGRVLKLDFHPYRDQMIISTKAGYEMWPGPYGDWGSRKYLIASLNQSLKRMGLEYVDIFYSHRPDPHTPVGETMSALDFAVRSGKALYAGISNYNVEQTREALRILRELGTPCLIHQPKYSMLQREPQDGLLDLLRREGVGAIAFSPLAQGLLTDRYAAGIQKDSRAAREEFLKRQDVHAHHKEVLALSEVAAARGQSLAQMALAWVLRDGAVCSALIGASRVPQIEHNVTALQNLPFAEEELQRIDSIVGRAPARA
jgi:L-glyceraldehyde 3-phosphate reductase